jgi:hypothetical protein
MVKGSTILLLGVGTAAALYGASYLMKLHRLSNELESVTKVSIYKVSLVGIDLRIDSRRPSIFCAGGIGVEK